MARKTGYYLKQTGAGSSRSAWWILQKTPSGKYPAKIVSKHRLKTTAKRRLALLRLGR